MFDIILLLYVNDSQFALKVKNIKNSQIKLVTGRVGVISNLWKFLQKTNSTSNYTPSDYEHW